MVTENFETIERKITMSWDKFKKEYQESGEYWKLSDGEVIEGYFIGEPKKVVKDFQGNGVFKTSYDQDFVSNGKTKKMQKSYKFYMQCMEAADFNGLNFENTMFRIKRSGTRLQTKYLVAVSGPVNKANGNPVKEIFKGKDISTDNIPF